MINYSCNEITDPQKEVVKVDEKSADPQVFYAFTMVNRKTGQVFTRTHGGKDLKEALGTARELYHERANVVKVEDCQTHEVIWQKETKAVS